MRRASTFRAFQPSFPPFPRAPQGPAAPCPTLDGPTLWKLKHAPLSVETDRPLTYMYLQHVAYPRPNVTFPVW